MGALTLSDTRGNQCVLDHDSNSDIERSLLRLTWAIIDGEGIPHLARSWEEKALKVRLEMLSMTDGEKQICKYRCIEK